MELKWLLDFVALAQTRSFSRAAQERNVTQPAYSRRVRALEGWVGATLLDRSSYPITLTPAGDEFLLRARAMIAEINLTRRDMQQMQSEAGPDVRILALHTLTQCLLPPAICRFADQMPEGLVTVLPSIQSIEEYFETLASGLSDIVVSYETPGLRVDTSDLAQFEMREVARDRLFPAAAPMVRDMLGPDWLEDGAPPVPYLSYSEYSFSERLVLPIVSQYSARLRPMMKSSLSEGLRQVALMGHGVAWLPEMLVSEDIAAGRLVEMPGAHLGVNVTIVAYRLPAARNQAVERFWHVL